MTLTGVQERVRNEKWARRIPGWGSTVDSGALEDELRSNTSAEVRFDAGSRALYATDASNYRQVPIGVVMPRTVEDMIETVAAARRHGAPVLARGGGTSLAGQCCNVAVVIDMSKHLNQIVALDPERKTARVQPGIVLDTLRDAAEQHHLTFGPDPATHTHCTLGGMIGNNSCGVHSVMAGKTDDNVEELEILTYNGLRMRVGRTSDEDLSQIIRMGGPRGEIYGHLKTFRDKYADLIRLRFPNIPRRVSGYDLPQLLPENGMDVARALVGSEGTCVTILEATVRLVPSPPTRALVVLGYRDIFTAADHVPEILEYGPIGLEGIDDRLVNYMKKKELHTENLGLLPEGGGWLLVEFGGERRREAEDRARALMGALQKRGNPPSMKWYADPRQAERVWLIRESGLDATANVPGMKDTWPGWEDSAVPIEKEGAYLLDLRRLFDQYGYECALYGHFGQGCVHVRIDLDMSTRAGIDHYLAFMDEASDLVVRYGGSLSGEHGDGQARAQWLSKMFGDELVQAFREFKAIWDPGGMMNPGKVVNAYRADGNLRLGTAYRPWEPKTHFQFSDDHGSFARAALRCVGVGECRREGGGTMCPSYMVTHEEEHSTRGRARLLFEMLQGQVIGKKRWRDQSVKDALDLCLACKGCKGDCPVKVDMATYKAEFLSHYYAGRPRPITGYTMGLIYWWTRLASHAPGVVNLVTQARLLGGLLKQLGGIAPERKIPPFAPQTFKAWFRERERRNADKPPVILWADTFNNSFYPETAQAAVEVLEAVGYRVVVPDASLCCGRPLYDYGFLDQAKGLLRQILDTRLPEIEAGTPVVGLEPSCMVVFRDELTNLWPHDEDARRLREQTFTLAEFLETLTPEFKPPHLERPALLHGHCHQKAIMKLDADTRLLDRMGVRFEYPDAGCCGMAGSFGFEKGEHHEVSIKAGERALLPAVRNATKDTLIIADGFSCREQIAQTTDRRALHLAQVVQMALHQDRNTRAYPEALYLGEPAGFPVKTAVIAGPAALAAGLLAWQLRHRDGRNRWRR